MDEIYILYTKIFLIIIFELIFKTKVHNLIDLIYPLKIHMLFIYK